MKHQILFLLRISKADKITFKTEIYSCDISFVIFGFVILVHAKNDIHLKSDKPWENLYETNVLSLKKIPCDTSSGKLPRTSLGKIADVVIVSLSYK